jgi:excisionase family DNA binding protein
MERELFGFNETAEKLGVSAATLKRLADAGEIRVVNVAARRLIPLTEIERIKLQGVGNARRRLTRKRTKVTK